MTLTGSGATFTPPSAECGLTINQLPAGGAGHFAGQFKGALTSTIGASAMADVDFTFNQLFL